MPAAPRRGIEGDVCGVLFPTVTPAGLTGVREDLRGRRQIEGQTGVEIAELPIPEIGSRRLRSKSYLSLLQIMEMSTVVPQVQFDAVATRRGIEVIHEEREGRVRQMIECPREFGRQAQQRSYARPL